MAACHLWMAMLSIDSVVIYRWQALSITTIITTTTTITTAATTTTKHLTVSTSPIISYVIALFPLW